HVVEDTRTSGTGASFDVVFSNDKKTSAKLVGRDPFTDIAVLQVQAQGLKAATLANSDNVPVGALTVAIGSPLGEFQNTVTHGIIANGKGFRGYLGIQYTPLATRQAAQLGLATGTVGIVVSQVVPGSPAEQAGIQANDIITKVNDQVIDADHPLSSLLVKN